MRITIATKRPKTAKFLAVLIQTKLILLLKAKQKNYVVNCVHFVEALFQGHFLLS